MLHGSVVPAMPRFHRLKSFATVAGIAVMLPAGLAQVAPGAGTPSRPAAASPILAPKADERPAPSAPKRTRAISPEAAAALAAFAPKYEPPAPKPAPQPDAEPVDMREIDKPKNAIVRLPKYIVQEAKPAVFRERDIHTEKGLTDIAMRRYISDADRALNRWTLPLFGTSKEARAMAMYAEDERLRNMADLNDAAVTTAKFDPAAGDYIRKESQNTFRRTSDFGWSSGEPK